MAVEFLKSLGHKIITTNYRYKKLGEIDIITKNENKLHFVEVKTRKNDWYGLPAEAVSYKKLSKIIRVSEVFRAENKLENLNYQLDVISITLATDKIEYYPNVTM